MKSKTLWWALMLSFTKVSAQCNGSVSRITYPKGAILSPGYPGGYSHQLDCKWEVTLMQGQMIHLYVNDLDLDPVTTRGAPCGDYVTVADRFETVLPTCCGNKSGQAITVPDHVIKMTFHTDTTGPTDRRGFNITYQAFGCPIIQEDPSFTVVSAESEDEAQQNHVTEVTCANGENLTMTCHGYQWHPTVEETRDRCLVSMTTSLNNGPSMETTASPGNTAKRRDSAASEGSSPFGIHQMALSLAFVGVSVLQQK